MRILMLLDKPFPPDVRVERELLALRGAGHTPKLLCEARNGEKRQDEWRGIEVERLTVPSGRGHRWWQYVTGPLLGRRAFWESWLRKGSRCERFDVVHCHDLPVANTGIRLARSIGAMAVFDRHEDWPGMLAGFKDGVPPGVKREILWWTVNNPGIWRVWERRAIRGADLVITVSREAAEALPVQPRRPVAVVSNYVDLEGLPLPRSPSSSPPPLRLCFSGVVNRMFALTETIDALALLPRGSVQLTFVGDGDDRPHLEAHAARLGLAEAIDFLGWRSRDEALAAVSDAHVCLLPLKDNALTRTTVGNKLFEYMALERPVLCSGVGVMSRIVGETGGGMIVEPWTAAAVALALEGLLGAEGRRREMGSRGRAAVLARYNWSVEREAFLAAYQALATRQPQRARDAS